MYGYARIMSEAHRAPTRHLRESSYGTLGVYANQPVRQAHTKHGPASVVCHPSVQHLGAISTCSQSPRGLATALALAWPAAFSKEMCRGQRAAGTYRHTGHSDAELKTATWRAARDVAAGGRAAQSTFPRRRLEPSVGTIEAGDNPSSSASLRASGVHLSVQH